MFTVSRKPVTCARYRQVNPIFLMKANQVLVLGRPRIGLELRSLALRQSALDGARNRITVSQGLQRQCSVGLCKHMLFLSPREKQ